MIRPLATACFALGALALATPAAAPTVRACDGITENAQNIVEPWAANSWAYYGGRVRVAVLDTGGEPACCSSHLLVMFEDPTEQGGLVCRLVGYRGTSGFAGIDPRSVRASYDARRGLLVSFGYTAFPPRGDGSRTVGGVGKVRVNLARRTVVAE